jgi:phosphoglycolate phosphatase
MRYPLIVFDFDGTLADSWDSAVEIFHRIGPGLGLKPIADPNSARTMPTKEFMRALGVTFWKLPKVVRAYQAAAAEHAGSLKLFPAWPGVLADLNARGHRLGILSSNR